MLLALRNADNNLMSLGLGLFRIGRISIEWHGYALIRKDLKWSDLGIVRGQKKSDVVYILS